MPVVAVRMGKWRPNPSRLQTGHGKGLFHVFGVSPRAARSLTQQEPCRWDSGSMFDKVACHSHGYVQDGILGNASLEPTSLEPVPGV